MTISAGSRRLLPWGLATAAAVTWITLGQLYVAHAPAAPHTVYAKAARWIAAAGAESPATWLAGAPIILGLALATAIVGIAALGRRWRIDPARESAEALAWSLRAPGRRGWRFLFAVAAFAIAALAIGAYLGFGFFLFRDPWWLEHGSTAMWFGMISLNLVDVGFGPALAATVALTGSRREALAGPSATWRPRLAWPGGIVVLATLLLYPLDALVDAMSGALSLPVAALIEVIALPLLVLLGACLDAAFSAAWVERSSGGLPLRVALRLALQPRTIAAYFALGMRWLAWQPFLYAPSLVVITILIDNNSAMDAATLCLVVVAKALNVATAVLVVPMTLSSHRLWVRLHPSEPVPQPAQG